jgi:hypothetical protein
VETLERWFLFILIAAVALPLLACAAEPVTSPVSHSPVTKETVTTIDRSQLPMPVVTATSTQTSAIQTSAIQASASPVSTKPAVTSNAESTSTAAPKSVSTPVLPSSPPATSTLKPDNSTVPKKTAAEVKLMIDSGQTLVLLDVRSKVLYEKSHIIGALSIPFQDLPVRYNELAPASEIIVYSACT